MRLFDDLAVGKEDDAVCRLAGKTHLVGHHDHGHAFPREGDHGVEHFVDHFGVERAGGFVEEHDLGLHRECAGDGDALLLTAGKLCGHLVHLGIHADFREQVHGFCFCL